MMPANDQERRPIVITLNLKILVIVIVTVALTFLFIRSNQTMLNMPTSLVKKVNYTVDLGSMSKNMENRLELPDIINVSIVTNSTTDIVTDHSLSQKQNDMLRNDQKVTLSVTKEKTLNTNLQDNKYFRSESTGLIQDDYLVVKPTLYWNKSNGYITNRKIDENTFVYKVEGNDSEVTARNGMYQMDSGSNSVNRWNGNGGYSTIDVNLLLSEENDLNSHYNVNDSSYSSGSYIHKEIEIPIDGINLVTSGQSEQINTIENVLPPGSGSNAYRPHSYHDFRARHPTGQALYHRPSTSIPIKERQSSKYVPDEEYYKSISQQPSKISLNNNSELMLIMLGILKLKMIGILQIIFLLGVKLKLFFMAVFTKFLLLTKIVKFFKIIMLPLILLSPLLVFAPMHKGVLASSSTQSSLLSMLLPGLFNNMQESSSSGSSGSFSSSSSSSGSGGLSGGSSVSSSSSSTISSDLFLDNLDLLSRESSARLFMDKSCDFSDILLLDLSPDSTIRSEVEPPYLTSKVRDPDIFSRQKYNPVKSFDPTLTISQKTLDSEKCVERIACRLAVAEKAGIIPLWIKLRILNGVSKLIPEEKIELYFKTYNFVNNAIETTKTPESWAEWCLERYNSDNITNRK